MVTVPDRQAIMDYIKFLEMRNHDLEAGINTVLDAEDTDAGWGPDITHVDMLRQLVGREMKYGGPNAC